MKATLEYNLPEDQREHEIALNGYKYCLILSDLDNDLRLYMKHGHGFKTADEVLEHIRQRIHQECEELSVSLHS
jgi:GGDEF domain-containing protein